MKSMIKTVKLLSLLLVIAMLFVAAGCSKQDEEPDVEPATTQAETTTEPRTTTTEPTAEATTEPVTEATTKADTRPRGVLNGEVVDKEVLENPIVGAMIDNSPPARQQSGVIDADIVFEGFIEGGSTRYMCLFQSKKPDFIGPLRSARPNFLYRAIEYRPYLAHCGGSGDANRFIPGNIKSVDGIYVGDGTMWRNYDLGRVAPHNMYTAYDKLVTHARGRDYVENNTVDFLLFNDEFVKPEGDPATRMDMYYNDWNWTSYTYNEDSHTYYRYKDGNQHTDLISGKPIEATNIIVQFAASRVYDDVGHVEVDQIGEGTGLFFSGGTVQEIHWKKTSIANPTIYYDKDWKQIPWNPGQTWIQVMNPGSTVNYD